MSDILLTMSVLDALNKAAKQATDAKVREQFYAMKAALLLDCLKRSTPQVVLVHFQTLANRKPSVLFTLQGPAGSRCWHLPWDKLPRKAKADISKRIGVPPQAPNNSDSSTWLG